MEKKQLEQESKEVLIERVIVMSSAIEVIKCSAKEAVRSSVKRTHLPMNILEIISTLK